MSPLVISDKEVLGRGGGASPVSDEATLSRRASPRIRDDSRTLPQPLERPSASRSAGVWKRRTTVS
ncbi:hypothetical protein VSDG_07100 [Cytospora chrysosperma]|uniref:Uncharacterized protein n=1 Tax=Cytospora chrysosperma TaxID=252740 RepID=A0A423VV66_CYTCH|nr:hypothetical protein VSDG_07100 [Valsa sordida]